MIVALMWFDRIDSVARAVLNLPEKAGPMRVEDRETGELEIQRREDADREVEVSTSDPNWPWRFDQP